MIPFSPPFIDEDVKKEVLESLDSGWITTGPKVKALEKEVADLTGVKNVLCVNSATSAMMLVLHWYGIGKGDEVIIPAYTYCATALAVMHIGAKPVIVDVGKDFNISTDEIKKHITPRTKAIVPVDIAGYPCDYDEIYNIVNDEEVKKIFICTNEVQRMLGRILIMSDAAHSIGAVYKDKPSGSLCDISVFSFHAVKNVTTAEGGAICLNLPGKFDNDELYAWLRLLSLNGQTKDAFTKSLGGNWKYDIVYPGFKINLSDICAAVGLAQIRKYTSDLLLRRKEIFERYNEEFKDEDWVEIPPSRNEIKETSYHINDYPVSYDNYSREITLPVYPQLSEEDISTIVDSVKGSYDAVMKK